MESLQVVRRQMLNLLLKRVVIIEHQAQQKWCPSCQQMSTSTFPQEVRAPVQYRAAWGVVTVYLVEHQLLPYERACEVMEDLLGISLSGSTLQRRVHASRRQSALGATGILPKFGGISIHDGWASYFFYACEQAYCNMYLLHDLIFLAEEHHWLRARDLKELLLDRKEATEQARTQGQGRLNSLEVIDWEAQFLTLLDEGERDHPQATAPPGTRGCCKQSAARNLLDRLRTYQQAFLCFLEDLWVDFDNHLAERELHMVKVQQKVSGCFGS